MSGSLFFDMPYGRLPAEKASWDSRTFTKEELRLLLLQFSVVNEAQSYHVGLMVDYTRIGDVTVVAVMEEMDFTNISPVVWYKQDGNYVGSPASLTFACEFLVVARHQRPGFKAYTNLDQNPLLRHNIILGSTNRKYLMRDDGCTKVNPTQKNGEVYRWFLDRFCKPGDTQMICGTGAGGEVVAGLEFGCPIVGLDTDAEQLDCLSRHLAVRTWQVKAIEQAEIALAEKKEAKEAAQKQLEEEEKVPECVVCEKSENSDPPSPPDSACFYCRSTMHKQCGTPCHENAMEAYCAGESCNEAETKWIAIKKPRIA